MAAGLALLLAAPVGATGECEVTVTHPTPTFFGIVAQGFIPAEELQLELFMAGELVLGTARTADDQGKLTEGLTFFEDDPPGEYVLRISGRACQAETTLIWQLPDTATDAAAPAAVGSNALLLLMIGGATFAYALFGKRWSRRQSAA